MRIFRIIRLVLVFILEWNHNEKNYQRTTNVCPSLSRRILDPSAYGFGMRSWSFLLYIRRRALGRDWSRRKLNNILLMRKWKHAFLLLAIAITWYWQIASLPEHIHLKNKLGDRMIKQLLIVIVSVWQIKIFCSTSIVQWLLSILRNASWMTHYERQINIRQLFANLNIEEHLNVSIGSF